MKENESVLGYLSDKTERHFRNVKVKGQNK